ncbi:hypothetical protein MMC17_006690 [Xylographa soralifera]|nr:hypothetical protein [Xylographa soralifera]
MAEAIELFASILTLVQATQVVAESVRRVIELYRAPAEIKTLQEQIDVLSNVFQAAEAVTDSSIQEPLSRARSIIDELQYVIAVKLIKQGGGSDIARRGACLRNEAKIISLRDDLRETREALSLALNVHLFSSTRQAESVLSTVRQQGTANQVATLTVDRRLKNIEYVLSTQQSGHATELELALPSSKGHIEFIEVAPYISESAIDTFDYLLQTSSDAATTNKDAFFNPQRGQSADDTSVERVAPVGIFETSASFLPETYTIRNSTPNLFCYDAREIHVSEYQRVILCNMFYSKAPRHWTGLTFFITNTSNPSTGISGGQLLLTFLGPDGF